MLIYSIIEGFKSIKISPLQTFFSILGIIIGVASLVAILALGDGMEDFARNQVDKTTSLQGMSINTQSKTMQQGVYIRVPDAPIISLNHKKEIEAYLDSASKIQYYFNHATVLAKVNDTTQIAGFITGLESENEWWLRSISFQSGEITSESFKQENSVWVNNRLIRELEKSHLDTTYIVLFGKKYQIQGIYEGDKQPQILMPITQVPDSLIKLDPPSVVIKASSIEKVSELKKELAIWKEKAFGAKQAYVRIETSEVRLKQAQQGLMMFRIVMGLITGISVLVGGIGVMNVLLMSVKERTPEIGIRKAIGAKRRHIVIQFLAESISISTIGSIVGLIFAALFLEISIPIIKSFADVNFPISWTLNTVILVCILSICIGIFFGTFPAWKAARLHPIEAIQRV
ncbi:FtsX-like permease family protein [bacterium]|nr:MAG: FtsX-like permease family protein [bacterium]